MYKCELVKNAGSLNLYIVFPMVCLILCRSKSELCVFGAASAAHFLFTGAKNMEKTSLSEVEITLLGDKMTYCREMLHFSKKNMAFLLDVSTGTLSKYEKGLSLPSVKTLYKLSLLMDMPMDAFASDEFSMDAFKEMSTKSLSEMFIELHNDIVKGTF